MDQAIDFRFTTMKSGSARSIVERANCYFNEDGFGGHQNEDTNIWVRGTDDPFPGEIVFVGLDKDVDPLRAMYEGYVPVCSVRNGKLISKLF